MTVTKTMVEESVEALPVEYQQRMARLVLTGWSFHAHPTTPLWQASHPRFIGHVSTTLLTLLDKMQVEKVD